MILGECLKFADYLKFPFEIDKLQFLFALSGVESSFGKNNKPRYEPAYGQGGLYFRRSIALQREVAMYGRDAASSWGPWQILHIVAVEYGYDGAPHELQFADVSLPFVVAHLNKFVSRGADTLEKVLDCYNSGNHRDANVPENYIQKFIAHYNGCNGIIESYRGGILNGKSV